MTQDWYYTKDRQTTLGPVSSGQLNEMARTGGLAPTDLVRKDGMPK
ncbi:MAG: DUF4339 domain-containing protein [Gemmataceae bacterium]|nr:DUF4339 domain-containing protein [Gemmataceae bacterium]MBY0514582.1 DUF4339 domain-containing protein [Gemmataceae bacterium]